LAVVAAACRVGLLWPAATTMAGRKLLLAAGRRLTVAGALLLHYHDLRIRVPIVSKQPQSIHYVYI
jgi:hypothetical protein